MDNKNASINLLSIDLFYSTYKDQHPCWLLILSALSFAIVAIVGMTLNVALIYVTIKTKSLRGRANFLLALTCVFEVLHQQGHYLFVFTAFSGLNFIPYPVAIRASTLTLFGLFGLNLSIFFTGWDRFVCVMFPIMSNSIKNSWYLGTITLICVAVSATITGFFYIGAEQMAELKITGTIGDLLKGSAGSFYINYALTLNTATIAIYAITGILIRRKTVSASSTSVDAVNRRLFRSLVTVVAVNIGGYFVMAIFLNFVAPLLHPVRMWIIRTVLGVLAVNVSAASNAPILYLTNSEYRKSFHKLFPFVFDNKLLKKNSVDPIVIGAPVRPLRLIIDNTLHFGR